MRRYRKLYQQFWKDEKIVQFLSEEKLVSAYLISGQSNRIGLFTFSPGEAAEDLGMLPERFSEHFKNVCQTLNFGWDETFRVLYIPTWWKYNPPENPNTLIGNLKDLDEIPNSPLVEMFINNLEYLSETLRKTFTQALAKRYPERYSLRSPSQEQEQEQEQNNSNGSVSSSSAPKEKKRVAPADVDFERAWSLYPRRAGGNSKKSAHVKWTARIRAGNNPQELITGTERYAKFIRETGKEGSEYVMQAERFYGPGEHWKELWDIPGVRRPNGGFVG